MAIGTVSARKVSYMPSARTTMKRGIRPPLKNMVTTIITVKMRRNGSRRLASG